MKYGWKEVPELYFTLKDGTLIGYNNYCKYFEESYGLFGKPWQITVQNPFSDFDLTDTLLSTNFDIYVKTYVRRRPDSKEKVIWYKYVNAEINSMNRSVSAEGEPAIFIEVFEASEREPLHENSLPEEIKNFKK